MFTEKYLHTRKADLLHKAMQVIEQVRAIGKVEREDWFRYMQLDAEFEVISGKSLDQYFSFMPSVSAILVTDHYDLEKVLSW